MDIGNEKFIAVASSEGVTVYCPREGRFSFFNSPYPAHKAHAAIDIYPNRNYGSIAPSPVYGEVKEIRKVACPEKSNFKSSDYDYVILIQSQENPKRWIKILHLEPHVRVSDTINVGDELGILLRSGFFDYWTDPHIHVEIRDPHDPIRARGGFKLERLFLNLNKENGMMEELRGIIIRLQTEYALMLLDEDLRFGVPVKVCGRMGLIDGGIPHYGFFGVHVNHENKVQPGSLVELCNIKIGIIEQVYPDAYIARCLKNIFRVKNEPVKISFYLYSSKPLVKIILNKPDKPKLEEFEEVSVTILGQQ
ncbi:MAG: hypothetical protein QXH24_00770 [Candidatus Bathyarchaeia archaeon]